MFSLLFGLNACGLIALSQANGGLLNRFAPRGLLLATLAAQAGAGGIAQAAALLGSLPTLVVGLFVLVGTIGMVTPNASALALDRHPERAGTAGALLGGLQAVIAALAAPLVGLGDSGRGAPMALAIVSCALVALLSVLILARSRGPA